jgi:hypothetical protein
MRVRLSTAFGSSRQRSRGLRCHDRLTPRVATRAGAFIRLATGCVAEYPPCLVEQGHDARVATEVGMMPAGETSVGGLDGVAIRVARNAEDLVVVRHRSESLRAPHYTPWHLCPYTTANEYLGSLDLRPPSVPPRRAASPPAWRGLRGLDGPPRALGLAARRPRRAASGGRVRSPWRLVGSGRDSPHRSGLTSRRASQRKVGGRPPNERKGSGEACLGAECWCATLRRTLPADVSRSHRAIGCSRETFHRERGQRSARRCSLALRLLVLPIVVPEPRFELERPCGPRSLSPLRLPVPPLRPGGHRSRSPQPMSRNTPIAISQIDHAM